MTNVGIMSPDELGVVVSINYVLDCLPAWHGFDTTYLVIMCIHVNHFKKQYCNVGVFDIVYLNTTMSVVALSPLVGVHNIIAISRGTSRGY